MTLPTRCGMPPLNLNIEGLRSHCMLVSAFVPEPDVSEEKRKWRLWLVHCLVKTARHYNEARALIQAQVEEGKRSAAEMAQGRQLPVLDFAFAMEDCITSLEKAIICVKALARKTKMPTARVLDHSDELQSLNAFRRQQEHMHTQIAAGQTGDGPIFVVVALGDDSMQFRKLTMSFAAVHRLIDALFRDIAAFFPAFEFATPAGAGGVPQISMSATIKVVRSEPNSSGSVS
jgi:hypothetical protein